MLSITGNWFAAAAILGWPIVALLLYRTKPIAVATIWTILAAFLLLPAGGVVKFAMIPGFDKNSVPAACALMGVLITGKRSYRPPKWGFVEILIATFMLSPVITSALNNDAIVAGLTVLPGVGYYDGISALLGQLLMFLPFIVGRRVFREADDIELLVRAIAIAGLFYSLPMLFEIRMSPQLARWIYGSPLLGFNTEMRYGGFRPVVFMNNGLVAAFFLATATLSAAALWRTGRRLSGWSTGGATGYLGVVLVLCKSAGALIYAIVIGAVIRWVKPALQSRLAVVLVCIALVYPVLRMTNTFPTDSLVATAASFNEDRALSLKFRFDQEQKLLEHAAERFYFGWGRYGRNRVHDAYGNDTSITDGAWIIILGQFGIIGFLAQFGLLALPVFRAALAIRYLRSRSEQIFFSTLSLIVALDLIEQLPNASLDARAWLLAGILLGRSEQIAWFARRARRKQRVEPRSVSASEIVGATFERERDLRCL